MLITNRPELSPEERRMPLAKYYDLPLYPPGPRESQLLDHCPIDPKLALKVENLADHLQPTGYGKVEYGYCMMHDGSGYMAMYAVYPNCAPKMMGWWFRWLNVHPHDQPEGTGSLKYKIWCPPDHFDHGFINRKDGADGIWSIESIDLGRGEDKVYFLRKPLDPKEYGLTKKREKELQEAGCWIDFATVTFHSPEAPHKAYPGTYLWLTLSRNCPQGGMEKCTRLWIGYGAKDGEIYFDKTTPSSMLCEKYMRTFQIHTTVEHQHLAKLLPELYAEYSDRPDDMSS
jgi:hypothetical protein